MTDEKTRTGKPGDQNRTITPADLGWEKRVRLGRTWDIVLNDHAQSTFGLIVAMRELSRTHQDVDVRGEASVLERALRAKFEKQSGTIRNSYFCKKVRGGAAVTEMPTPSGPDQVLHTVLTTPVAALIALENECQILAEQVRTAFRGQKFTYQAKVLFDAIYSAMTRVLSAADLEATASSLGDISGASVPAARDEVANARARVEASTQREARFVYLQGSLTGMVVAAIISALLGLVSATLWVQNISPASLVASTLFGALGAVLSVFQRMSTGALVLDFNASRGQIFALGSLRPLVGAVFGAVIQFALVGGVFAGAKFDTTTNPFGFFALVGFIAGFSERFATDMVERAGKILLGDAPRKAVAVDAKRSVEPTKGAAEKKRQVRRRAGRNSPLPSGRPSSAREDFPTLE
jgi:hypothetical protein